MAKLSWKMAFVLPNLQIGENWAGDEMGARALCLGVDGIAVVRGDDERVLKLRATSPGAEVLMGSFRSEHGEPYLPSALIIRSDLEAAINRNVAAIIDFRNAVAMAFILPARARLLKNSGWPTISWAEFFDFHPTTVARNDSLYTFTPAYKAYLIPQENFQAMPSTAVNVSTQLGSYDPFLVEHVGTLWRERYVKPGRDSLQSRLAFRSLEAAVHGASMAQRNAGSLNEYGMQVSLWVTALEVLARTPGERSSQKKVLNLLDAYPCEDRRLRHRRYRLRFRDRNSRVRFEPGTVTQKLCNSLYEARHRFVHGDHVGIRELVPRIGSTRISTPRAAALVYRAALVARLSERFGRRPWSMDPDDFQENRAMQEYESALT